MVHIGNDWDALLADYFASEQYQTLRRFLVEEYRTHMIYPNMYDIFNDLGIGEARVLQGVENVVHIGIHRFCAVFRDEKLP